MDSELLTIAEPVVSPPAPRVERPKSPGQMSYSDLRKRIKELESALASRHSDPSHVAELTTRLEQVQAEKEQLSARLASYDHAETQLRQAAEAHLTQSLALFNARSVALRQKFRDFDTVLAVLESKPDLLRLDVRRTVVEMENGPFILYTLIKSPDFCRQLQQLPFGDAVSKIVLFGIQIEQKLIQESVAANYLAVTKGK